MTDLTPKPVVNTYKQFARPTGISTIGRIFEAGVGTCPETKSIMALRDYPGHAIVAVAAGVRNAYYEDVEGFRKDLVQGDIILVHPNRRHRYGAPQGGSWFETYISFDGPIFDLLETDGVLSAKAPPVFHAGGAARNLRRCLFDESERSLPQQVAVGKLVALLTQLAVIRAKATKRADEPEWVAEAMALLEEESSGAKVIADQIAKKIGISSTALNKQFLRRTGMTMGECSRRARITHAVNLLENTDMPLKGVSFRLGFVNEQHFSRTISAATGFTPGAIRKRRLLAPAGEWERAPDSPAE